MDSQTLAQDLEASILSATTPPKISAALSSIAAFLRRHTSDQLRPFFSLVFPSLLRRLFGFDSISWLEIGTSDRELSSQLFTFLAPGGPLFSSISSVDQESLVRYIFPTERLPEWMRYALQSSISSEVLASISPLFSSRIKEDELQNLKQIQLNVFQYYIFWFAYYPVSRGTAVLSNSGSGRATRKTRLENWVSSIPVISSSGRKPGQRPESSLYLQLLYSYLKAFVPKLGSGSFMPYRSSLLNYSMNDDELAYLQAEFVVQTFVQFWMVDNDLSPLPAQVARSLGLSFLYQAMLGTTPLTPGLGDVLKLLVNYLYWCPSSPKDGNPHMLFDKLLQRPLYRFILRSFLYCPIGASVKNSVQIFSLWMAYIQPWHISKKDFTEFESTKEQRDEGGNHREKGYTVVWRGYVLDNYLFYSSLVVHFLEFAHKFIHADVESVTKMVSEVLEVLCSSTELLALLYRVNTAYSTKQAVSSSYMTNDLYKYVSSIQEKLQDWEDGMWDSDINVSILRERSSMDLRFFSDGDDGASNLLQLLILRAEHEIHLLSGDVSRHLQFLDLIKAKAKKLFGEQIAKTPEKISPKESPANQKEYFTLRRPKVGKYKGDWMKRPISDTEVAWLAVVLIRVSDWLNQYLSLDGSVETDDVGPTYVEVKGNEVRQITGPKEVLWLLLMLVFAWFGVMCNLVIGFMRRHGMKINLRFLASKRLVAFFVLSLLWPVIVRGLSGVGVLLGLS
ncbi:Sphingomyelin phosphodiesterase 4 [Rhynchospora pubera]|uniref:Sphingomyelin phosphodiesterase 4 n=1 Tax=Rhynchospora pubera TaxID=906938 RepID=A0AAV8E8C6_9POAL|nr:Sphingomyelin phosphodiesterase 4 [Rhynchospora pubera]